ncbi:CCC1 [Candida jiufengensis]|uniref:CCC1 n=1 Tax=Candida jiufengensis TaxID=497108 RepID=UPI002224EC9C|nr:CCC1 [Candida jiufengensis]KAI5952571.1 CCC1 [Candida jiufengensis]
MSLVALKNGVSKVFSQNNKSDDELQRVNRLLDNNQNPYGSTDNNGNQDERASAIAREEAVIQAAASIASSSENKEEEEINTNFLTTFFNRFDPRVMSDIIIGLSDGLTVPFALTAGLSSLGDSKLVITGGMAELVSGAISMGLGGYLAAKSESEYYHSQVKKEKLDFFKKPDSINQEAAEIMFELGASDTTIISFLKDLDSKPRNLIDFVIRFGKGLEEPAEGREFTSALTIGLSYFLGGFVPLLPYFFTHVVQTGLIISVIVMLITLFIFGFIKTSISLGDDCGNHKKVAEGIQMVAVGSVAAGAAWGLVYFIDN